MILNKISRTFIYSSYLLFFMPITSFKICPNYLVHKISFKKSSILMIHNIHSNCKKNNKLVSVYAIIKYWHQKFVEDKISEPKQSIEHIVAHVLGILKISELANIKEKELSQKQLEQLEQLCQCRLSRMPIQYIIGKWDFRYITLKMEPPIFIPRPETELLVDILLKRIDSLTEKKCNILEIGCGSGAISLSLLHSNKNVNVVAIDTNAHACELTIKNARDLQIENRLIILNATLKANGLIKIQKEYSSKETVNFSEKKFQFIVSNPPYISTRKLFELQPEINLYEDVKALDGGNDGLKLIIPILKYASEALNVGGFLILEVDSTHSEKIKFLINQNYTNKFKFEKVHKDFCDKNRFIEILKLG